MDKLELLVSEDHVEIINDIAKALCILLSITGNLGLKYTASPECTIKLSFSKE